MKKALFLLATLVIITTAAGLAEAQPCYNTRLCGEYYGGSYNYHSYYPRYNRGYYGYDWRVEAVRGGLGVVGQVMDNAALAGVSRDQRDVAMAQIHATATRDARPGRANVSSSWGHMEAGYDDGGFENSQSHEEQRAPLPEWRHVRNTPRLDVVGLEKLLSEPGVLKAEEFVAVSETVDEYLDPSYSSHSREVHRENLRHLRALLGRATEEWQKKAIASAIEYIREGILS